MSEQESQGEPSKKPMTGRQSYNLATDTVLGPNVRLKDNLYQGLAILITLILGAGIGCFAVRDRLVGAVAGGLIGMIVGLFGSGIFLMIYRAVMHAKGKHD